MESALIVIFTAVWMSQPLEIEIAAGHERFQSVNECIAAVPAVFDNVAPPEGVTMEVECRPMLRAWPEFKPR